MARGAAVQTSRRSGSPTRKRLVPRGTRYMGVPGRASVAVGLLSGGYGEAELTSAGAYRVYRDAEELRGSLDELGVLP